MATATLDGITIRWVGRDWSGMTTASGTPNLEFRYSGAKRMEDTDVAAIKRRLGEHGIGYTDIGDPEDLQHYQQPDSFRNSGKVIFHDIRSLVGSRTPAQIETDMQSVFRDMLLDITVDVSLQPR